MKILHIWSKMTGNVSARQFHNRIFRVHPEYRFSIDPNIEKTHIKLWKVLRNNINLDTLRLCSNISGNANPYIVPEEVFASDIQRSLCGWQEKIIYISNKSFYKRWYQNDVFPEEYIHNIDGGLYNNKYEILSENEVKKLLQNIEYPVVIKPNMGSMGGKNVYFPKDQKELESLMNHNKNYIIQKIIHQDDFFAKYNRHGLNTIRVNIYRSVITNEMQYLHAALRIGKGGGLDNETAGGIHCFIHPDGHLNHYAVDKYGNRYERHPDTKLKFSEADKIPKFYEMKKLAIKVARDMYLARLISLDMCLDKQHKWRVIEINLNDITIRFAQYGGEPFFGQYTEEVINYCKNNPWWKKSKL
jgi:hypothetical protein